MAAMPARAAIGLPPKVAACMPGRRLGAIARVVSMAPPATPVVPRARTQAPATGPPAGSSVTLPDIEPVARARAALVAVRAANAAAPARLALEKYEIVTLRIE